jgi:hypothetical protein
MRMKSPAIPVENIEKFRWIMSIPTSTPARITDFFPPTYSRRECHSVVLTDSRQADTRWYDTLSSTSTPRHASIEIRHTRVPAGRGRHRDVGCVQGLLGDQGVNNMVNVFGFRLAPYAILNSRIGEHALRMPQSPPGETGLSGRTRNENDLPIVEGVRCLAGQSSLHVQCTNPENLPHQIRNPANEGSFLTCRLFHMMYTRRRPC